MNSSLLSMLVLLSICVYLTHSKSLVPDGDDTIDNQITQSEEMARFKDWFEGEVSEFASELAQEIWKKYNKAEVRQEETIKRGSGNVSPRGCNSKWSGWKFMGTCQ